MSMYANMKFSEHVHREYPKFVQTGFTTDPSTKTKVPTGVTVNSAEEEEALTAPAKAATAKPEAARAAEPDEPAPRPRGRPPGSGKTDPLAKVDPDQDPDA